MFLERFYPDDYLDSAYQIDFGKCYEDGYRAVLFDIDNTLVPHGEPADARALELFARLRGLGMKYCLISNNRASRVEPFADEVQAPFISRANKPSKKGYQAAMEQMGTEPRNTLFVGDQLFTDVYGARRAGIRSILVKPICPKEEIQIVLKRYLERVVLYFYRRKTQR